MRWHAVLAVLVVAASLVAAMVIVLRAQSVPGSSAPEISAPATTSPSPPTATAPTSTPTARSPGPAADTVHVDDRHRARYGGRYVGWDELLDSGRPLPRAGSGCRADWTTTRRDAALNWKKASYVCLDQLTGRGFKPQGVGGSGSTADYRIGGRAAAHRNIVLVSSYSTVDELGLRFAHRPGKTAATRLTAIDLDRGRFNQVELVRPVGSDGFAALDSHGSGFVWVGQYMYASSRGSLWMFNADDLMEIDGRHVLPAVAGWRVRGVGALSSIGVDRSTAGTRLTGINYTESGTAWAQSFALSPDGRLATGSRRAKQPLDLLRSFGPVPAAISSTRSSVVAGTNFQGIGAAGPYRFVNSSSLMLDGRRHGDTLVVLRKNEPIARFAMPEENIESVYVDYRRRRYVTVTEHGRQFLFWLPLDHLIDRAER
ncbi:MAG TPA: hypothetical protein VEX57_05335 [Microlunatus sp.]|nr:hypothetical protein [Microlunatus sp.]